MVQVQVVQNSEEEEKKDKDTYDVTIL